MMSAAALGIGVVGFPLCVCMRELRMSITTTCQGRAASSRCLFLFRTELLRLAALHVQHAFTRHLISAIISFILFESKPFGLYFFSAFKFQCDLAGELPTRLVLSSLRDIPPATFSLCAVVCVFPVCHFSPPHKAEFQQAF